jgi:hypothetical protein
MPKAQRMALAIIAAAMVSLIGDHAGSSAPVRGGTAYQVAWVPLRYLPAIIAACQELRAAHSLDCGSSEMRPLAVTVWDSTPPMSYIVEFGIPANGKLKLRVAKYWFDVNRQTLKVREPHPM